MAQIQYVLIFMVLCSLATILAQISQGGPQTNQGGSLTSRGGPHENQGRVRRWAKDSDYKFDFSKVSRTNWTTCDFTVVPRLTCHDCRTMLICKPVGGILKGCKDPSKPHCNNGICWPVPTAECA